VTTEPPVVAQLTFVFLANINFANINLTSCGDNSTLFPWTCNNHSGCRLNMDWKLAYTEVIMTQIQFYTRIHLAMHTDVSHSTLQRRCFKQAEQKPCESEFNYILIRSVLERGDISDVMNGRYTGWTMEGISNPGKVNTFVSIAMRPVELWGPSSLKSNVWKRHFAWRHGGNHSPPSSDQLKNECSYAGTTLRYLKLH
jgi:hypothetical protein